ncbi:TIGR03618 family F420-dependent PPOX class oxidoreductase [Haloactinomyces albus]|uniref:beta-N-acetylhexosaminidase n=1 Tax=Haloactinomyces albus TaxID=1352928 RepID=A0AAE4CL05_9ACTN|nr:TIGR03618 family F420-dependent PPOX class oxidoreductase [Haloactinomyces albus]MDR7301720.1 PPOX class probable F420-dependent enzyme [Haloactinomyces albus]
MITRMSLLDKVGQLFVTYACGHTAETAHPRNRDEFGVDTPAEVIQRYRLGGLVHLSWTDSLYEPKQIAELSNGLQSAATTSGSGIPLLISTDQEQGSVTRIGPPATQLPGSMALGAGNSTEDAELAAAITGRELRAMGVNQNFAPVGDVNADLLNPVIGTRSFSSDPMTAARMTRAQVRGYQDSAPAGSTVSATVKHFPGHGDTRTDSHASLPIIDHSRSQWERFDAPPFREAIAEGADAIMTAHLVLPHLDDSGKPATLSPTVLTGMLRTELGFNGVIITDSLRMGAVRDLYPAAEIPVRALQAGADQLLMPRDLHEAVTGVLDAMRSGELSEKRIDASVERILAMKARRGVLEDPFVDVARVEHVVGAPWHEQQARRFTGRCPRTSSAEPRRAFRHRLALSALSPRRKGATVSVVPQELQDIMTKRSFAHVATIGPKGEPQSNPVWVDWDGEYLKFSQTTTRQKYRNLQRDSRIAVSVHDPEQPYRYLEVRGKVARIDDDPDNGFINKMAKKYTDADEYPYHQPGDHRVVVYIQPEHTTQM